MTDKQLTTGVIWEDTASTELVKSCSNNNEREPKDIINDTKSFSMSNQCENTGKEKKWKKKCPKCGKEQVYSCKSGLTNSIKKNAGCQKCSSIEKRTRPAKENWKRRCPNCNNEIIYYSIKGYFLGIKRCSMCRKCGTKESAKNKNILWMKSYKYKNKMSKSLKNKWKSGNHNWGEDYRKKCRENKLKQIRLQGTKYTYNPNACKFIDNINEKFNWDLQHAMNGGEIMVSGYSLDGYDKLRNIVFEYDEPKHKVLSIRKKDKEREIRIIKEISPIEFWRYDEQDNILREIINKKEIVSTTRAQGL